MLPGPKDPLVAYKGVNKSGGKVLNNASRVHATEVLFGKIWDFGCRHAAS